MSNPRYVPTLCGVFAVYWIAIGIAPHDRADWALENALTGVFAMLLFLGRHRYPLSPASWTLLLVFALIHTLGSHYTYSLVPYEPWGRQLLGISVNDLLGWERNNFDRVVHFLWGFLLYLPVQEWFLAGSPGLRGPWRHWFPLEFIMATSLVYELIEWAAAEVFGSELGVAYLGTQGDIWDAQKDMALATAGGLVMLLILALYRKYAHTDFGPATS
jgi:putative membrane protein